MKSRSIATKIIVRVLEEGAYSNIALSKELNENNLNEKDRGLVTEIVYGVLRRKKTLDFVISHFVKDISIMDKRILNILRCAMYQLMFLDKIPSYAVCNEAVDDAKKVSFKSSKLVNGVLRNYLKNKDSLKIKLRSKLDKLAYEYSFESWLIKLFIRQYGEEKAEKIMEGLNKTPELTVRTNTLKTDFDTLFKELEEKGYNVSKGAVSPFAISIKRGSSIENNELFNLGHMTVQDESAMLVAPIMDIKEGDTILDLCSAPGGKTTHIGEILKNTGEVKAFDLHENKLSLIKENCDRLGISNVQLGQMDATILDEKLVDSADKILIDVPCSGLGIIKRKPEIKWNKTKKDIDKLGKIQRVIMENAWKYLKNDGIMVYSTCTLNKEENENNINWFLSKHDDCKIEKIYIGENENLEYTKEGMLTVLPNEEMDGFFISKLRKIK